jgi:hypothetical protein
MSDLAIDEAVRVAEGVLQGGHHGTWSQGHLLHLINGELRRRGSEVRVFLPDEDWTRDHRGIRLVYLPGVVEELIQRGHAEWVPPVGADALRLDAWRIGHGIGPADQRRALAEDPLPSDPHQERLGRYRTVTETADGGRRVLGTCADRLLAVSLSRIVLVGETGAAAYWAASPNRPVSCDIEREVGDRWVITDTLTTHGGALRHRDRVSQALRQRPGRDLG